MSDAARGVTTLACGLAQTIFKDRQGAFQAHQRFGYDQSDRREMGDAEPEISHPIPVQRDSHDDRNQTQNHVCDVGGVKQQDRVGQQVQSHQTKYSAAPPLDLKVALNRRHR